MQVRQELFIGGAWVAPSSTDVIEVLDSATEQVIGTVPRGRQDDVDAAVDAAGAALDSWASTPAAERAKMLRSVAEHMLRSAEAVASDIAGEVGTPIGLAQALQVERALEIFAGFADVAESYAFTHEAGPSLVVREPAGVVAAISPWNFPLLLALNKVGAALAAGCTVVLKPAEQAPFSLFHFADACAAVGLPAGVFNLVTGYGKEAGEPLAAHPDVDMVSFTGSTAVGKRLMVVASERVKRVGMELGGKSACVVLDDADLTEALTAAVEQAFMNSGQICFAWSRIVVPRARLAEAEAVLARLVEAQVVGDPRDPATTVGPLVSERQRDRVEEYLRIGVEEGAKLVAGGPADSDGQGAGYYVRPTIFSEVESSMRIAQEEIFGPVLAVIPHDGDDDAVRIANDTVYGLHGAVFSADHDRAMAVAGRMRTGVVDINGAKLNIHAPFGGYKQSGLGRELGVQGMEEYLETKSIQV